MNTVTGDNVEKSVMISGDEICKMLQDTSQILAAERVKGLSSVAAAYKSSSAMAENVGFWDWMNQNYSGANGHMFADNNAMQSYVSGSQGKADWMYKQLQGKGYEWDWMQRQRHDIRKIFNQYNAGTVSNQPGFDVAEKNILSGQETQYQMKAYISRKNPDLHNTDTGINVVTNAEKVDVARQNGYQVEEFKNREQIIQDTDKRMGQIENGSATPHFELRNVGGAMAKAGAIAFIIGAGTETVVSYRRWKKGDLTNKEYVSDILRAGGDAGLTAAASAGVMIPVSAAVTAAGVSAIVTIPIAVVVSGAINKVIAPCFGRGKYREILGKAKYYQALEDVYDDFIGTVEYATNEYMGFISQLQNQDIQHERMKQKSMELNKELKDLYNSI